MIAGENFKKLIEEIFGAYYCTEKINNYVLRSWYKHLGDKDLSFLKTAVEEWIDTKSIMPTIADINKLYMATVQINEMSRERFAIESDEDLEPEMTDDEWLEMMKKMDEEGKL